jgi:hypothetical protein
MNNVTEGHQHDFNKVGHAKLLMPVSEESGLFDNALLTGLRIEKTTFISRE